MRQKLFKFNNLAIKLIFYFLFSLTFYFALTSPNIILGDNRTTRIGTTSFTTICIIIAAIFGLFIYISPRFRHFLSWLFVKQRWRTAGGCLILVILGQISFIALIHPPIGFDVGGIHYGLLDPTNVNAIGYFSVNPNNVNILLLQHWFAITFHQTNWLFFDYLTLFFVDLSTLLNLCSIALIDRNKVPAGMYIHALWLLLFPMIIVPYTDTWVLPFISLYILCYCILIHKTGPQLLKAFAAILLGLSVSCAYFVKPSGIIPAIAIILVELISLLGRTKHDWWLLVAFSLLFSVSAVSSYRGIDQIIKNQTFIRVNSFRAKPMIHFINMGLSGDGGYNAKDSYKMAVTIDKQARIDYSVNSIKKRLRKMGITGYLVFLWHKQSNNTADGSFAWVKEGDFIHGSPSPSATGLRGKIQNFIYLYGNNLGDFRFWAQTWWCIWLGLIFFAWHDDRKVIQILRLAIIGGFIFLLIFEGGRSRYLIQFLPAFLLLATLGIDATHQKLKWLFSWIHQK